MKIVSYAIALVIGLLAVTPPINFNIPLMINSYQWLYMVILSGLFGMFLIYTKINISLKVLCVYLFLGCFLSQAPYLSFNAYILVVACVYFLIACHASSYRAIVNMVQAIFWLEVIVCFVQLFGKDTLMNFNRPENVYFGTIFQNMRFGSLFAILSPLLLIRSKWYLIPLIVMAVITESASFALSVIFGAFVYFLLTAKKRHKVWAVTACVVAGVAYSFYDNGSYQTAFQVGRIPVWWDIVKTWFMDTTKSGIPLWGPIDYMRILVGHGMDTFLPLFPIFKHDMNPFPSAHNDWLQLLWETGIIGFSIFSAYCFYLVRRLFLAQRMDLIAGLSIISVNMFFAFPWRMTQTVLLMICFVGYCEKAIQSCGYYEYRRET